MIVGIPPFNDDNVEKIFDNSCNLKMEWPEIGYEEDQISPEAADLIKQLLTVNYKKRLGHLGSAQVKEHKFFKGNFLKIII